MKRAQSASAKPPVSALDRALRALARREYGIEELRRKLEGLGYDPPVVEETLHDLLTRGLLSERRFIEELGRTRRERGYGPLRVRRELRARGVEVDRYPELVNERDPAWVEKGEELRRRRFGAVLPKNYREWARQARFLQARGYTAEQIRRVLGRGPEDE